MLRFLRELPLVWFLMGASVAWLAILLLRRSEAGRRVRVVGWLGQGSGLVTLGVFVALNACSLWSYMLDIDEADILSISALSTHGKPVYHAINSASLSYSMMYGPLTFLIYHVGLLVGGGRFWVMRAMVVLANLLLCFVLYSTFRKVVSRNVAVALMALPLCQLLIQIKLSFGLRPDIWIVLGIALAVRATLMDSEIGAAILAGFFAGIVIDLKATVGFAFLLLLLMLYRRSGLKSVAIAAGVATLTGLAPFALPNISLANYWSWLTLAGHETRSAEMVGTASAYAIFLILPLVLLRWYGIPIWPERPGRRPVAEVSLLVCCLVVAIMVASKTGAGIWHFWQLTPILAAYAVLAIGRASTVHPERIAYAVCILAMGNMVVALSFVRRDISMLNVLPLAQREQLSTGRREIDNYLKLYGGRSIQMGYGDRRSLVETLRYIPVLRGQPYTLDASERLEVFLVPFPSELITKMAQCRNDVWLIPHGEPPFVYTYVYPPELHDTFVRDYKIDQQGAELDAWVCKAR